MKNLGMMDDWEEWSRMKVVLVCLVSVVIAVKIGVWVWWKPMKMQKHFAKQGIRGPPYRLLIGNLHQIVSMMLRASSHPISPFSHNILPRVLSFYHHWNKIYGPTFLVWFGTTLRLTVSEPELIRQILSSNSQFYEKNDAPPLVKQLEGDGLLTLKGHKWAHHRKIISPTFHLHNLKLLIPVMERSVEEMSSRWSEMSSSEVEIEVAEWFEKVTEEVVSEALFGRSCQEEGKAIFRLQSEQMALAADAFQKVFIPGYTFFPTNTNIKCWRLDREIKRSLANLIENRTRSDVVAEDLIGVMMRERESSSSSSSSVTVEEMVEECKSFFFAGKHTTSNLLTWTTILLAMHPHWQHLARHEVLTLCGPGPPNTIPITYNRLLSLKTVSMIINESLRLYPPTIATIRRAKTDVELGGYKIPCGTELLIPILAVHHDQAIWGNDANEFNPDRFSHGVATASNHPMAFMPFGLGARTCIGQNLALLHTKMVIAMILQRFTFRLAPHYKHAPTVLMLLHPQYGAPILFKRLQNHH